MPAIRVSSLLGLFGLLWLSACSGGGTAPASSDQPSATPESVRTVLEDALSANPALAYTDLMARIGPPVRERAVPAPEGTTDSLRTLIYYGVEFTYPAPLSAAATRPVHIALTDARFTSPEGLRVGYAQEQVRKTLGPPSRPDPTEWVYTKSEPVACRLVVFLEQNKVSRVEWQFH